MKHVPSFRFSGLLGAALFVALLSPSARAAVLTPTTANYSGTSQSAFDSFSPNLLAGLTPSGPASDAVGGFNFSLNGINDGAADGPPGNNDVYYQGGAGFSGSHTLSGNPTVTFTFASPVSIGTIESVYGWQDNQSFSDQDYTISYTLGSDPTVLTLGSIAYDPFDPANDQSGGSEDSSQVILSGLNLTDVSSLSFQFTPYDSPTNGREQGAALIREFEVFSAPEPSAWAMLTLGGLGLLAVLKWRRLQA
jgi:hypothetical protein